MILPQFFDCAEGYGGAGASERVLGECLQKGMERGLWERMDLVISTKLFGGGRADRDTINSIGLSRKHLYEGMVASLERLQLDYVDLVRHLSTLTRQWNISTESTTMVLLVRYSATGRTPAPRSKRPCVA